MNESHINIKPTKVAFSNMQACDALAIIKAHDDIRALSSV